MRKASRSPTPRWPLSTSNPPISAANGTISSPRGGRTDDAIIQARALKVLINRNLDGVGRTEHTALTTFTDGCSGLRRILAAAGVTTVPFLDWFHIGMRLQDLQQIANALSC